jgi:hypothetical protein
LADFAGDSEAIKLIQSAQKTAKEMHDAVEKHIAESQH